MNTVNHNISLARWQAMAPKDGPFMLHSQLPVPPPIQGLPPSQYTIWRDPQPSECGESIRNGITLSDSGYATIPQETASVVSHSLDRSPELMTLARGMSDLNTGYGHQSQETIGWPSFPHDLNTKGPFHCPFQGCKSPNCKTRSELNKHYFRHAKPFKCEVATCRRSQEGFSTKNDLDRHNRSVHNSDGPRFRCIFDDCINKNKLWPRADNFKAHLERAHQIKRSIDQLGEYKFSEPMIPPASIHNNEVLIGSGSNFDNSNISPVAPEGTPNEEEIILEEGPRYSVVSRTGPDTTQTSPFMGVNDTFGSIAPPNSYPPEAFSLRKDRVSYGCNSSFPHDESARRVSGVSQIDSNRPTTPMSLDELHYMRNADMTTYNLPYSLSNKSSLISPLIVSTEEQKGQISKESQSSNSTTTGFVTSRSNLEQLEKLLGKLQADGTLQKLGYIHAKNQPSESGESQDDKSVMHEETFKCLNSSCTKTFSRKCERTKHMKRHERPYGCTFKDCTKTFGSKNDWKRHENDQHFQLEVWKCDVFFGSVEKSEVPCGKVSYRRENFRTHLQHGHGLCEDEIETRLENCRIGRNWEGAFWCGFCKKRIPLQQKGKDGWDERFNHINDHFFGKGQDGIKYEIKTWEILNPESLCLDEMPPEFHYKKRSLNGKRKSSFDDGSCIPKKTKNVHGQVSQEHGLSVFCSKDA